MKRKNMRRIVPGVLVLVAGLMVVFSFTERSSENILGEVDYEILEKWELPAILEEVSGIAWIGENRIACIQDENGIIFIYNLKSSRVENSVSFSGDGDYEGITVFGENAYVLRSDGVIFEVEGFMDADPQVNEYVTQANQLPGINIEGLCADTANHRLLLAVKERHNSSEHKEIYSFDLDEKDSGKDPLFIVELNNPIFSDVEGALPDKFEPGEIGIHPQTGEYFILDGSRPKLLIVQKDNAPKELFMLEPKDFGNPEGLTFSPEGDLYISNEADDAPANILKVSLKRK